MNQSAVLVDIKTHKRFNNYINALTLGRIQFPVCKLSMELPFDERQTNKQVFYMKTNLFIVGLLPRVTSGLIKTKKTKQKDLTLKIVFAFLL